MGSTSNQESASIVDWKNSELCNMDRKTRKALNIYQALHTRSNVNRLYLPRSEGGKGLLSLEGCVNAERMSLGQYLKMNEDEWLRSAWEEALIKENVDPKENKEKTSKSRMKEWQSQPLHGQFLRQTKDLSNNDTWQWLQKGKLKKETERMIMAAQNQNTKNKIHSKSH